MIPEYLRQNLDLFRGDEYTVVIDKDEEIHILEAEAEGEADLESYFEEDAVIFHVPEKRTLPYLDAEKKACQCADKFIFIKNSVNAGWQLHILEFKKSIKYDKWKKIRNQFKYGIMNARALAAFLNIEIDEIILETAYRNDWNPRSALQTPTMMRAANSAAEVKAYEEWRGDCVWLELDSAERSFRHDKIKLDESGKGIKVYRKVRER